MSSPFYVWDAEVHAGLQQTLQEAEALAYQRPIEGVKSTKIATWLPELNAFVNNPVHRSELNADTLEYLHNMMQWLPDRQRPWAEVEYIHADESEYFYRELVQSIQRHNLVAYDTNRGLFISKDYMLPYGIQPIIEQEFAQITKAADEPVSLALDTMPKNAKQLQDLILAWFEQHDYKGEKFKLSSICRESGNIRLEREDDTFYEAIKITAYFRGSVRIDSHLHHEIVIKPAIHVLMEDKSFSDSKSFPPRLQTYKLNVFDFKKNNECIFYFGEQIPYIDFLQDFFESFKNYLDIMSGHLKNIDTFNNLVNHDDVFNFKKTRSAPGHVLYDLVLAKLCNDPLYEELYTKKIAYFNDLDWREQTIQSLLQIKPLDNLG